MAPASAPGPVSAAAALRSLGRAHFKLRPVLPGLSFTASWGAFSGTEKDLRPWHVGRAPWHWQGAVA